MSELSYASKTIVECLCSLSNRWFSEQEPFIALLCSRLLPRLIYWVERKSCRSTIAHQQIGLGIFSCLQLLLRFFRVLFLAVCVSFVLNDLSSYVQAALLYASLPKTIHSCSKITLSSNCFFKTPLQLLLHFFTTDRKILSTQLIAICFHEKNAVDLRKKFYDMKITKKLWFSSFKLMKENPALHLSSCLPHHPDAAISVRNSISSISELVQSTIYDLAFCVPSINICYF